MWSLLSSMPSHPATHSTPAAMHQSSTLPMDGPLPHTYPPPGKGRVGGRERKEGSGGRGKGKEKRREGRGMEREESRDGRVREEGRGRRGMHGEGAREQEGVHVGQNTRTCGLWDTHIQEYIITSSSHITSSTHLYCIAMSHCRKRAK